VWLNGRGVRILSRATSTGDVLDVLPGVQALAEPPTAPPPLVVLHEDAWIFAVDKPVGVASQAPRQRRPGEITVHERVLLQLAARDGQRREVLLFHRLDRLTTGVLAFARHHEAARALVRAWAAGSVEKRYLAIVCGDPGSGRRIFDGPITADPLVPGRFRVARGGRPARTELRRLAAAGGLSLVELRPRTGRTHQVRVHLADAGVPVAGDALYDGGGGVARPFLHAWKLTFPHPRTGSRLHIEAPIPADMAAVVAELGWEIGRVESTHR
jgi:23S rRNA pseudouridine1911/1915/1917 synthase